MNIFDWKSAGRGSLRPVQTRANSAYTYAAMGHGGAALGQWPMGYEAQVREGYRVGQDAAAWRRTMSSISATCIRLMTIMAWAGLFRRF